MQRKGGKELKRVSDQYARFRKNRPTQKMSTGQSAFSFFGSSTLYIEKEEAEVAENTGIEIAEWDTEAHCSAG